MHLHLLSRLSCCTDKNLLHRLGASDFIMVPLSIYWKLSYCLGSPHLVEEYCLFEEFTNSLLHSFSMKAEISWCILEVVESRDSIFL